MEMLFTILIVAVVLFIALREVFCWYWKINERIALQKETNSILAAIANKIGVPTQKNDDDAYTEKQRRWQK